MMNATLKRHNFLLLISMVPKLLANYDEQMAQIIKIN